mmetsp:Transcript_30092/g.36755  ORF Transcript_30092/g.36755 Transcript_30092/m.36755 type:complete len:363 (-) Transcript_30092:116-1204(-)|eukprot:CAMPEP_0172511988 /NCGR_PEP_ID=MMETSP1066-20121228/240749_1 /TAXON_ID=671091 /ORGANISM="Coscinodiscus wailesii, Strain CCMP2513" /LENGTH=362 /DNA_ID=CAMNT_0013291585 /DNA_START=116 /DNA_END=1204 /DNA_ORIENTATION=-
MTRNRKPTLKKKEEEERKLDLPRRSDPEAVNGSQRIRTSKRNETTKRRRPSRDEGETIENTNNVVPKNTSARRTNDTGSSDEGAPRVVVVSSTGTTRKRRRESMPTDATPTTGGTKTTPRHRRQIPTPDSARWHDGANNSICATTASANALMNSSQYLAYSWDGLRLGEELGASALNEFIGRVTNNGFDGGSDVDDYRLTAQDTLKIVDGLRAKTCFPPKNSDLHGVVQKTRFDNNKELPSDDDGDNDNDNDDRKDSSEDGGGELRTPLKSLARMYEFMCAQDADDGSYIRREMHYLSAKACVEKLRNLENTVCDLKLKETSVTDRAMALGLHPLESVHFTGFDFSGDSIAASAADTSSFSK